MALLASGVLASSACGRAGYDPLPNQSIDGGMLADASASADGGGTLAGCLEVTTATDESDGDEGPLPPHAGTGLSLREAITIANQAPGADCIGFAGITDIAVQTVLPGITGDLIIDGGGTVTMTGTPSVGLAIDGGAAIVRNLDIGTFATCIDVLHGSVELDGVELFDCKTRGVRSSVSGLRVTDSVIRDSGDGVVVGPVTTGHELLRTLIHNGANGVVARGVLGMTLRHVTIVQQRFYGVDAALMADEVSIVNSIVFDNGTNDVRADEPDDVTIEYSLLGEGGCMGCTPGTGSVSGDPMFTDPVAFDYTLAPGSPAIDSGTDTGADVNGSAPGLFNGEGPDMGALESPPL